MSAKPKFLVTSAAGRTGRETVRLSKHRDFTLRGEGWGGAGHFIQEEASGAICNAIEAWQNVLEKQRPVSSNQYFYHAKRTAT